MAFSGDHEYFNGIRWKPIREYCCTDKVLQFNKDGSAELVEPLYKEIVSESPLYEAYGSFIPSCLDANHRVVWWNSEDKCYSEIEYKDVVESISFTGSIPKTCLMKGNLSLSSNEICDLADLFKSSPVISTELFKADIKSRLAFINTVFVDKDFWVTEYTQQRDFLTDLAIFSGCIANKFNGKVKCGVHLNRNAKSAVYYAKYFGMHEQTHFREIVGQKKYSMLVPSGMIVVRRNGSVFVTGAC